MLAGVALRPRAPGRGRGRRADRRVDVADLLVRAGVPFREAHGVVAGLVRAAVERGAALELSDDELAGTRRGSTTSTAQVLASGSWLESKVSRGGTALARVREQLAAARAALAAGEARASSTAPFVEVAPRR